MKQYGHIKLSRKFFETDDLWNEEREYSYAEAWIDLIQMAAWRKTKYLSGARVDAVNRGEFVASLRYLGTRWMWGKNKVSRFLKMLEKAGQIAGQRPGQHGTVYLIVKYDAYQSSNAVIETPDGTPDGTDAGHLRDKEEAVKQLNKTTHGVYPPEFDLMWAQYPNRKPNNPKGPAYKAYVARLRQGVSYQDMFDGTIRYAAYAASTGIIGTRFVKQAATFYGPDRHFAELWESPARSTPADPLGGASSALKRDWLVKMGYASADEERAA